MYRLLIVDDERIARESTYGLLATQEDLELELLTADSAVRAVSILEKERVDITIMDINMPQMTGLELYSVVRKNWPQCKVIFLTGYSEFDYVYQVHKHARYVLKADREEVLLEAVRESIREIENEMIIQRAADADSDFKRKAGKQRANVFVTELIDGYIRTEDINNEVLREMDIGIDCRRPVYTLLIRCEDIADLPFQRNQAVSVKIYRLLEKYYSKDAEVSITYYKKINLLVMVQPQEPFSKNTIVPKLASVSSIFLNALQLNAEADAAVLVAEQPMLMAEVIHSFGWLYDRILQVEKGDIQTASLPEAGDPLAEGEKSRNELISRIHHLELDPENAMGEGFLHVVRDVRRAAHGIDDMHDLYFAETYQRLSALLLRIVRMQAADSDEINRLGLMDLYNPFGQRNWEQAFSQMEDIAEKVISLQEKMNREQEGSLVSRMKRYIERHLVDGPSLTMIADHYHYSREYLLRVFKKEEGITILQYINDRKLEEAKKQLASEELSVKEIGERLGFSSTAYFIRFFRAKTGMSPAAFRKQ